MAEKQSGYKIYIDGVPLPIIPEKIETKINGKNKTITLINEGEVNQIKTPGLTEISFTCLIPQIQQYPFAYYKDNKFKAAVFYLAKFENLLNNPKPFKLHIIKKTPSGTDLSDTTTSVTLENYTITEDAKNGFDIEVAITLKKYRNYGIVKYKKLSATQTSKKVTVKKSYKSSRTIPKTYTVKKGDTLLNIAKKQIGDNTKKDAIYKLNKTVIEKTAKTNGRLSSSNGYWIYPGTVLKMPS